MSEITQNERVIIATTLLDSIVYFLNCCKDKGVEPPPEYLITEITHVIETLNPD